MTNLPQRAFNAGIIGPAAYSRTDISKFDAALKDAVNCLVLIEGGVENRAGTQQVTGYAAGTPTAPQRLIPFTFSTEDTYQLEFGDSILRVIRNGAYVLDSTALNAPISEITAANPARVTLTNLSDAAKFPVGSLAFIQDPNGTSPLHRATVRVSAVSGADLTFQIVGGVTVDNTGGGWGGLGSGATISKVYQIASPFPAADLPQIVYAQDVETLYFAHPNHPKRILFRDGADDDWVFALVSPGTVGSPPGGFVQAQTGTGSTVDRYVVTRVYYDVPNAGESAASVVLNFTNDLTVAGNNNRLTWIVPAELPPPWYNVYKRSQNGEFGYIGSSGGGFTDNNITPDLTKAPPTGRDPFNAAGDYASVVAFIEQRVAYANSPAGPQVLEMSSSRQPEDFERSSVPRDDDAISIRLRGQTLNRVVALVAANPPYVLTSGQEFALEGGDNKGYLTPGNPIPRPVTYWGSTQYPQPVVAGSAFLHVLPEKNRMRAQRLDGSSSRDITVLVRHLFRGRTIRTVAYAQAPYSVVWVTLDDGTLLSFSYLEEHDIWAWTRHELGGDAFVHQVSVVREGGADVPYFVVQRDVGGAQTVLVERLATRDFLAVENAYFVDAGLTYQGAPTTALRSLLHLRGKQVAALADGNVLDLPPVDSFGKIALGVEAEVVHIGYGYEAFVVTLGVDFGMMQGLGGSVGRLKTASEVAVMVDRSRGIAVGFEDGFLNEVKEFTGQSPIPLFTGTYLVQIEGNWFRDARIKVSQQYPLPMTITAIAPNWEIEG